MKIKKISFLCHCSRFRFSVRFMCINTLEQNTQLGLGSQVLGMRMDYYFVDKSAEF